MTVTPTPPLAGAPDLHAAILDIDIGYCAWDGTHSTAFKEGFTHAIKAAAKLVDANAVAPQSVSVPESARHMLEETANKLVTYTSLYTGDKQAKRLIKELRELAANIIAPAALLPQPQADAEQALSMRESFEACKALKELSFSRDSRGVYVGAATRGAWKAWKYLMEKTSAILPHQGEGSIDSDEFRRLLASWTTSKMWSIDNPQYAALVAHIDSARLARTAAPSEHPDDLAVDRFATAMKAKMAAQRAKGYGGWDDPAQCTDESLADKLMTHAQKGDPVDVANFCMMLHQRHGGDTYIVGDMLKIAALDFARRVAAAWLPAAPAPLEAQPIPTDLSKRLRDEFNYLLANRIGCATLNRDDILAAADEIDRYYGASVTLRDILRVYLSDFDIDAVIAKKGGAA